jgi:hypothetical protein
MNVRAIASRARAPVRVSRAGSRLGSSSRAASSAAPRDRATSAATSAVISSKRAPRLLRGGVATLGALPSSAVVAIATPSSLTPLDDRSPSPRAPTTATGGRRRGDVVVSRGLPIPIIGGLFTPPVLAVMYVFVCIRFWLGYNKTSFTEKNKAMMVGLWPVLAVASASFRENLKKAAF